MLCALQYAQITSTGERCTTVAQPIALRTAVRHLKSSNRRGDTMSRFKPFALLFAALLLAGPAAAQSVLRIGMTAADIPATTSQPDSGFEGNRFTGITMFDGLTQWDLSSGDKPSTVIPGLAES